MPLRTCFAVLVCCVAAAPIQAELAYDVTWEQPGEGGYAAPNVFRDLATGKTLGIVTCEGATGVVCLDLDGTRRWAYAMAPPVSAAPAVADLDGDGREDLVAADSKGNVVALNEDGRPLWAAKVPARVIADSCPALADLDGDGRCEILIGDVSGTLSCLDNMGALRWQFSGDGTQMGPVLVADVYDAPGQEIIVTSHDQHIYALTARGEWLWDLYFKDDLFPNSTPILADVDGDSVPELYVGGGLHHFYRIDLRGHRVVLAENVHLHINGAISAADLDGDGKDEVVFGNKNGGVWCYGADGYKWTREFRRSGLLAAPVFLNLDGDAQLEIIMPSGLGDVQFLDTDGSPLFSAKPGYAFTATPFIGDFDDDGMAEMIATEAGGYAGKGRIAWVELGVPYRSDLSLPRSFSGNRANSGRAPDAKAYPLLPTPDLTADEIEGTAEAEGSQTLLTGPNTWRFDVKNPEQRRLILLAELTSPDGLVRRFARHVHAPAERRAITFDVTARGQYTFTKKLMDGDALAVAETDSVRLRFNGFKSDERYLQTILFARIQEAVNGWQATNPRCAAHVNAQLAALRGMLTELARADGPDRVERLASVHRSAERLEALAEAGAALAPSGAFCAWEFNPWAYFDGRDTLPSPKRQTGSMNVSLCAGEYESLALNITNLCERTLDVRVRCGQLENAEPGTAPAQLPLSFRKAVTVPTFRRERVADALPLLDSAGIITVPSSETAQLWITVSAEQLEPGTYVTPLLLKSVEADPTEITIPITITVHGLELPRPRPLRFCLWSYDGGDLGADKPEVLADLVQHGVTIFFGKTPTVECDAGGNLAGAVDFTAHDESVARLSPHGMVLFTGPQGAVRGQPFLSEPWKKAFIAYLRAWAAHMKELGLDYGAWALYPYDEPSTPFADTTLNLVEVAKLVRDADPNILIYTDPTSGTTMETVRMFTGLIDIWCPSSELLERLAGELVPVAHKVGKEVWFYDAAGRAKTLSCLGIYRWRFWYAWNLGFTGAGWWCYHSHGSADRWDGPNETGDFFATVYDGPDGVVSSKRWEAAREGVEDYEYLFMLREAIRAAEERGVANAKLGNAKRLLETLPRDIEATLARAGRRLPLNPDSVPLYDSIASSIHEARQHIVDACLDLKAE